MVFLGTARVSALFIMALGPGLPEGELVARMEGGRTVGWISPLDAVSSGLTVVDLGDNWASTPFSPVDGETPPYRATSVALANERFGSGAEWDPARRDRYFELFGIFPSPSVVRGRLLDERRHSCHDAIEDGPIAALKATFAQWSKANSSAVLVLQAHLRCEGMLGLRETAGQFDGPTQEALRLYQRKQMLPETGTLDFETRIAMVADSRELDFRSLLRTLRERVTDAAGLIEDGSASATWQSVLDRQLDANEFRPALRPTPLPNGAPDLVSTATEAAALALGWTAPEAAREALFLHPPAKLRVAVRLPPPPFYHLRAINLRVEIDRGDVWLDYPLDRDDHLLPSPVRRRATLTVYATADNGVEIALVRWPTTIGGWKDERRPSGNVDLEYKGSAVGRRLWRDLLAGPAWFPPPTTPDKELIRRRPDGRWAADMEAIGPGYRSAYGLVAMLHHRPVSTTSGSALLVDQQIRSHGSGNYRSILRGSSHGCHRLFNHLALRLASFLLQHREHRSHGSQGKRYSRILHWKDKHFALRAETRGYLYELVPPVPIDVLPGKIVHRRRSGPQKRVD